MRVGGLLVAIALLAPAMSAGCFLRCGWPMTMASWNQPGVYQAFAEPGSMNGFTIEWVDDHGGPPGLNHVARRSTNSEQITVAAEPDDRIYFDLAKRTRLDNASTATILNASFQRLGLPAPQPDAWGFSWEDTIC